MILQPSRGETGPDKWLAWDTDQLHLAGDTIPHEPPVAWGRKGWLCSAHVIMPTAAGGSGYVSLGAGQAWVLEGVLGLAWTASGEARPHEHQGYLSQLRLLQQNTTHWVV